MTNKLTSDEMSMLQLFQQLPLEQCIELFKTNYNNYSYQLRTKLYIIIGAKSVWGEKYEPNHNKA